MPYVFSLEGYAPTPLYATTSDPPLPFTHARLQWASTTDGPAGPWTDLELIALDPVDADPAQPLTRDFTTRLAPAQTGWLRVVWIDAEQNTQPSDATPIAVAASWAPSVQDVADVSQTLARRPINGQGQSAGARGAFDETTNPKASQVQAYIDAAVAEVTGRVGLSAALLEPWGALARTAAKWHAATTVEAEHGSPSADTDTARAWKQASYVASLNELISQARLHMFSVPVVSTTTPSYLWPGELLP